MEKLKKTKLMTRGWMISCPRKKKEVSKTKKEKIDLKKIKPSDLTRTISDTEEIRKKEHAAKNQKTFGLRQIKSSLTSFENIIDNWSRLIKKDSKLKWTKQSRNYLNTRTPQ